MISNNMSPTLIFCFIFVKFHLKGKVQMVQINMWRKHQSYFDRTFGPCLLLHRYSLSSAQKEAPMDFLMRRLIIYPFLPSSIL